MSFSIYMAGFVVLIIGLALAANLLHVPPKWIGVGVVVIAGSGHPVSGHYHPSQRSILEMRGKKTGQTPKDL